jgi:glycine/D-amino acid oxidase-like deaminating enzyme
MSAKTNRIAIVGAGSVGATLAYQLSVQGLVPEIFLIDANPAKAEAEAAGIAGSARKTFTPTCWASTAIPRCRPGPC